MYISIPIICATILLAISAQWVAGQSNSSAALQQLMERCKNLTELNQFRVNETNDRSTTLTHDIDKLAGNLEVLQKLNNADSSLVAEFVKKERSLRDKVEAGVLEICLGRLLSLANRTIEVVAHADMVDKTLRKFNMTLELKNVIAALKKLETDVKKINASSAYLCPAQIDQIKKALSNITSQISQDVHYHDPDFCEHGIELLLVLLAEKSNECKKLFAYTQLLQALQKEKEQKFPHCGSNEPNGVAVREMYINGWFDDYKKLDTKVCQ